MSETFQEFCENFKEEHKIDPSELSRAFGILVWNHVMKKVKEAEKNKDICCSSCGATEMICGFNGVGCTSGT